MTLSVAPLAVPLAVDEYGVVRVAGTRVTLDTLVGFFRQGASADELAEGFPTVGLASIYAVIGYYLQNRAEVDAYLKQREDESRAIRREIESRPEYKQLRERHMARRAALRERRE